MKIISSADLGARLEAAARAIAPALVAVYTAGFMFGQWIHATKTKLAGAHARWIGDDWRFSAPAAPAIKPPPIKPIVRAVVTTAPALTVDQLIAAHTQRELMAMAGTRSKRSKKQLAERILRK